ncbi:ORF149, putative TATA box binding protein [White spot syndrome virus]|uniref:Wsv303 n=4 Tax=White spot syndrome virus TaxID=342409 RepID=Q77J26_WSSVS|nr:wsv303 [Shrimp white spot syndrome virus]YP_009220580.1 putative TATA-box bind protein [White spot syndrome virus]AUR53633.1 putative TATA box binding protein [White spot syndrome virus consensus sequence]AYW76603.1 putative TATA box binding protein [Procambarus clarkii virus]AAK77818.1 ORF149, putative TATA box binding protein [White spot syndrome virus]AAL24458.1 putative TATA-box binding protein [White spot syndrome virus]AAL33305.1 wsv303 [Shrimp white spot syndrome virus]
MTRHGVLVPKGRSRHVILGNVDYTFCTTDNNCVSLDIDFKDNITDQNIQLLNKKLGKKTAKKIKKEDAPETKENSDEDIYATKEFEQTIKGLQTKKGATEENAIAAAAAAATAAAVEKAMLSESEGKSMVINRARMVLSKRDTSQKQFTALKNRESFFSVLIFETGSVIVVGLQDPSLTKLCVIKATTDIADILQKNISVANVSIVNTVSTFNRFHLNFIRLGKFFERNCISYSYNPETFPGMFFKLRVPAKPLLPGETIGEYYTKVAMMRDSKDPNFKMSDWLRIKTALTFKVGKITVLGEGESGCGDVSVVSKLLFGLFHYFMDNNIKMSPKEAQRVREKYGIPHLEWYLYIDMLLHSYPYVKPSAEQVKRAMVDQQHISEVDRTYYGTKNSMDAAMSANLVPSKEESISFIKKIRSQQLFGHLCKPSKETTRRAIDTLSFDPINQDRWWNKNDQYYGKERCDPFSVARLVSVSENTNSMMNSRISCQGKWWLDENEYKDKLDHIVDLCTEEIVEECESKGFIASPFLRKHQKEKIPTPYVLLARACNQKNGNKMSINNNSNYLSGSSRAKRNAKLQEKHRVTLARLNTMMASYRFLNNYISTDIAPDFAKLFGNDVYSLLHLMTNLPKSRGHALTYNERALSSNESTYKTPGNAYFSTLFEKSIINNQETANKGNNRKRKFSRIGQEKSSFLCNACGVNLNKGSDEIIKGICTSCDQNSTSYIENALSDINRDKKIKRFKAAATHPPVKQELVDSLSSSSSPSSSSSQTSNKNNRCTPSDFIDYVYKFTDETTGAPKVGLVFKMCDILASLASRRGMEDRPTANYRTSLHSATQNKTNLNKLLVSAIKETGATETEAQIFNKIIGSEKGLSILCQLVERRNKDNNVFD